MDESQLVEYMARNQVMMVQAEGAPKGVQRMVIMAAPRAVMFPAIEAERADTVKEFQARNALVIS